MSILCTEFFVKACVEVSGCDALRSGALVAQKLKRLLQLYVFGLWLGSAGLRSRLAPVILRRLVLPVHRIIVIARQVFRVNRFELLGALDLDRWDDA